MGPGQDVGHGALETGLIVSDAEAIVEPDANVGKLDHGPLRKGFWLRHALGYGARGRGDELIFREVPPQRGAHVVPRVPHGAGRLDDEAAGIEPARGSASGDEALDQGGVVECQRHAGCGCGPRGRGRRQGKAACGARRPTDVARRRRGGVGRPGPRRRGGGGSAARGRPDPGSLMFMYVD